MHITIHHTTFYCLAQFVGREKSERGKNMGPIALTTQRNAHDISPPTIWVAKNIAPVMNFGFLGIIVKIF
jgi:hypothetical protein